MRVRAHPCPLCACRGASRSPSNGGVQRGDAPLPGGVGVSPTSIPGGWVGRTTSARCSYAKVSSGRRRG